MLTDLCRIQSTCCFTNFDSLKDSRLTTKFIRTASIKHYPNNSVAGGCGTNSVFTHKFIVAVATAVQLRAQATGTMAVIDNILQSLLFSGLVGGPSLLIFDTVKKKKVYHTYT